MNFIRARARNHRIFQNHLATFDAEYGVVLFYNSVRWLSRGAVLDTFVALFPQIINFLEKIVPGLKEQFLSINDDLVLFLATKEVFREDAQQSWYFSVARDHSNVDSSR